MKTTGRRRRAFISLAVSMAMAVTTFESARAADDSPEPGAPAIAVTIDAESLIELYQSVPDLKIIDARHNQDYTQGYIETSYNLPLASTNCESLAGLVENKDQAMVFYCNGISGDASIAALQIASSCGYRRLFWFRGGFVEWEDKDYPYVIE